MQTARESSVAANSVTVDKESSSKPAVVSEAWMNRFAALTVDETEEFPETDSSRTDIIKVEAVEDEEFDEGHEDVEAFVSHQFFRIFCLFHDLKNYRAFIGETVCTHTPVAPLQQYANILPSGRSTVSRRLFS